VRQYTDEPISRKSHRDWLAVLARRRGQPERPLASAGRDTEASNEAPRPTVRDMADARYDAIAEFYSGGFDSVDDPASQALLELLGPVVGLDVLDVACGHGRITRELARRGASVVGVDISGQLIGKAVQAERAERLGIRYVHTDASAPGALRGVSFDAVVCHFGLSDIDDLDGAAAAISGALRPSGRFVFAILHPCFGGGTDIAGSWPTSGSYYDEGRWTPDEARSTLRRRVGASHRMLSTYVRTLRGHDLWLDEVAEPRPAPGWDPARDADRKPVHLVVRAVRAADRGDSRRSFP